MQPNDVHETIARYLHNMKPERYRPGIDVGISIVDEWSVIVDVVPAGRRLQIRYDRGPDLYSVREFDGERPGWDEWTERIYCDQLGEVVFGGEAEPWTLPMVAFITEDGISEW
jgi:hypothetical protein